MVLLIDIFGDGERGAFISFRLFGEGLLVEGGGGGGAVINVLTF